MKIKRIVLTCIIFLFMFVCVGKIHASEKYIVYNVIDWGVFEALSEDGRAVDIEIVNLPRGGVIQEELMYRIVGKELKITDKGELLVEGLNIIEYLYK